MIQFIVVIIIITCNIFYQFFLLTLSFSLFIVFPLVSFFYIYNIYVSFVVVVVIVGWLVGGDDVVVVI